MTDPLARFVAAQDGGVWDGALAELRAGDKRSHWMWFVFPQIDGLGRSETARLYAIRDLDEARAYLAHPRLGPRLLAAVEALSDWAGRRTAERILGAVDAVKLRSSATLFEAAGGGWPFARLLDRFFDGTRDSATLALISPKEHSSLPQVADVVDAQGDLRRP